MVSEIVKDVAGTAIKESAKTVWEKGMNVFASSVLSGAVIGVGFLGINAGMKGVEMAGNGIVKFAKSIFKKTKQPKAETVRGEINIDPNKQENPSGK